MHGSYVDCKELWHHAVMIPNEIELHRMQPRRVHLAHSHVLHHVTARSCRPCATAAFGHVTAASSTCVQHGTLCSSHCLQTCDCMHATAGCKSTTAPTAVNAASTARARSHVRGCVSTVVAPVALTAATPSIRAAGRCGQGPTSDHDVRCRPSGHKLRPRQRVNPDQRCQC